MHQEHANHNEDLCDILKNEIPGYNDWIVTTAFYSCIHYVEHKLFPLTIGTEVYPTFDYYYAYKIQSGVRITKHNLKINLVNDRLRHVWSRYKRLHDICRTARYLDYQITDTVADQAIKDLKEVKAACI